MSKWINCSEEMPEQGIYVLCISKTLFGGFAPPFVSWCDSSGFVGSTNYRPSVDMWQKIEYPTHQLIKLEDA